nr:Flp pilus assembly protein CpaB [Collinsella intestinalis]
MLLSVASGVLACVVALWYGSSVRAEAEQMRQEALAAYGGDLVSVCVATRDVDAGEVLSEANVHVEEWVASLLPEDAETSLDNLVGERATSAIPARAVISPVYLERGDGAIEVPAGTVAVSVAVDEEHAVGGALAAGDAVDVYVSTNGVADRLCRATVIATSAEGSEAGGAAISWATLAVEPERVSEVLAATAHGSVSLTLPDAKLPDETDAAPDESAPASDDEAVEDGGAAAPADEEGAS